ncbi:hypothetical protein [Clostridium tyrobutyricum]|jgi:cytochrome bd-type quinol oxidase subunit 2|uniref:hypothetical protein n=1 Tax=Clostridium tyrobutyricum TaxID=1519 RepID=UPI000E9CBD76|nr:hypothetical protein [Clostridium tyrobutyricum]HBF76639.1 hypothetical protein [Clostridiaceae bacterium]
MQNKLMKPFKKIKDKMVLFLSTINMFFLTTTSKVFAAGGSSAISTQEVTNVTEKIKNVITQLAMPIGSLCILVGVISTAIRIAVNHNNPKERTENLNSLWWLAIASFILGAALLITGVIINVTSNNGVMY